MFQPGIKFFSLPGEIRNSLTAKELQVFYLIFDLFDIRSKANPYKPIYAFPSERYLASKVGCTREWVSRCVQRLQSCKLITITHRRKVRGHWQTNLYRFGTALARCLTRLTNCISSPSRRVNKSTHIAKDSILTRGDELDAQPVIDDNDHSLKTALADLKKKLGMG